MERSTLGETLLELPSHGDRQLQIAFEWQVDRYEHALQVRRDGGPPAAILVSSSAGGQAEWPSSPPFQQLAIEQQAAGPVALLIGMAGKSHWSASIEPLPQLVGFRFDVACRVTARPTQLLSTYRVPPAGRIEAVSPRRLSVIAESCTMQFELGDHGDLEATASAESLAVRADVDGPIPGTRRWVYEVWLENALD